MRTADHAHCGSTLEAPLATKTIVSILDDLEGGEADETITFALDGRVYEIDLNAKNATELREFLDRYMDAGRQLRRGAPIGVKPAKAMATTLSSDDVGIGSIKDDRPAIQAFAKKNGLKVPSDRGRVAADIIAAWEAAGSPR